MQLLTCIFAVNPPTVICVSLFVESLPSGGRCGGNNEKIRRHITGTSSEEKQHEFIFLEYQQRRRVIATEEWKLLLVEVRDLHVIQIACFQYNCTTAPVTEPKDRIYADRDWPVNRTLSVTVVPMLQYCCRIEKPLIIYGSVVCWILWWILLPLLQIHTRPAWIDFLL